jgi:hypothetical protein
MNSDTEDRIKAVDILDEEYELRLVDPANIKIAGHGRSQKRSYVDDERSLSRIKDFEDAYTAKRDIPPMILEELESQGGAKTLLMVDGNHRLRAIKNLNGSAPTEIPAFVISRCLSEHERAALTCQANSGGPIPMLEAEVDGHIADSLSQGISQENIVKHYPNVTEQRVRAIKRAGDSRLILQELQVTARLKTELANNTVVSAIRRIKNNNDAETARRLDTAIKQLNSGKLSLNEFGRIFNRCDTHDAVARTEALAGLDETIRNAERPRLNGKRSSHVSIATLKSDLKRFINRDDNELARLARDIHARQDVEALIVKLNRAVEATNA